ncbi:multiprotein-bridging factor 1 family protein [Actinokineospora soli]|uniref:Multiprotein-bridging factor 1 family protein n=1 Tax=Actinokineospora soli TaxID=1048753 RepID=A0ABW2TNA0_9PSEU
MLRDAQHRAEAVPTPSSEFGPELRRLRMSKGLSLASLGQAVYFTKGYLAKVERGQADPSLALATLCDRALGTEGRLVAALAHTPAGLSAVTSRPLVYTRPTTEPTVEQNVRVYVGPCSDIDSMWLPHEGADPRGLFRGNAAIADGLRRATELAERGGTEALDCFADLLQRAIAGGYLVVAHAPPPLVDFALPRDPGIPDASDLC